MSTQGDVELSLVLMIACRFPLASDLGLPPVWGVSAHLGSHCDGGNVQMVSNRAIPSVFYLVASPMLLLPREWVISVAVGHFFPTSLVILDLT